ncbi:MULTISPECIES: hypothetical protein [Acidiphilium]|uniref:hypothetical protein n=1 Tax=Acidiphilium TaxID=522 RepID=UPI00257B3EB5|nr:MULTISPECIES: hypothetical protein [Acidiphilium]HQT86339.1 hypothetical protein [Acidiphilium rubrum]
MAGRLCAMERCDRAHRRWSQHRTATLRARAASARVWSKVAMVGTEALGDGDVQGVAGAE